MRAVPTLLAVIILTSCGKPDPDRDTSVSASTTSDAISTRRSEPGGGSSAKWELLSSGEGVSLALGVAGKPSVIRFFCPNRENKLKLNVQKFRPVGSEERMTVGSGGSAVVLVAGAQGDPLLGGVSGIGEIPDDLADLLDGHVSANYGAQNSGPHIAPPQNLVEAFVTGCNDGPAVVKTTQRSAKSANACLMQDGRLLRIAPRRAIGTEPFWGARIEGRCIQYSHIDDQKGTRIWTRYTRNKTDETWSGTLDGKLFELKMRNELGCSDGMSEKTYPLSAELKVDAELRRGCAEPA
jgi:uncharacterized membrane protein